MKFKRAIISILAVLVMAGTLTGCTSFIFGTSTSSFSQVNNDENTLNVFIWSEYLPDSVIEGFEAKYNIEVNCINYSSNEEMLAGIMAGNEIYDIAVASDYMVDVMRKQKLMEELDLNNIPNLKNIGSQFKNMTFDPGNKFSVPYMWGDAVIAVNTKMVPITVTSYGDLWDSRFKNSLVVLDDERAVMGIALKKLGYSMNETDPARLEQARQELLKLKPNIKKFDSDSSSSVLIKGEAAAGYVWGAEAVLAQQGNKDIKIFFPKEGMYLWQDNFVIPKGAEHKKNAEIFINYILDPKVSAEIPKEYPYANPNIAAHQYMDKSMLNNTVVYPTENDMRIGEHLKDLEDATKLYDKIWTEVRGK